MDLQSPHLLVRDIAKSLDLEVNPQELGKCTSLMGSLKLPSVLGRLPDARGIAAIQSGLWEAKHCILIIPLQIFFSSSSLFILASPFVGKGEKLNFIGVFFFFFSFWNNLSQPQGLGSKQPGNTGRGKDKPYSLALQVSSQHKYLLVSFVFGGH